jgi:hypothetical protein
MKTINIIMCIVIGLLGLLPLSCLIVVATALPPKMTDMSNFVLISFFTVVSYATVLSILTFAVFMDKFYSWFDSHTK